MTTTMNITDIFSENLYPMRNIYEFLPGKPLRDWTIDEAVQKGCLHIIKQLKQQGIHGSCEDADTAAEYGHLHIIKYFRRQEIYCTEEGLYLAAENGHLHIIQDLYEHKGIRNDDGKRISLKKIKKIFKEVLNFAAIYDHLHIIKYLRQQGINGTEEVANLAAEFGYLHIIQDLRQHGINCTEEGIIEATSNGYLHIVQDLYEHGIYYTQEGLTAAIENRHREDAQYLLARIAVNI